MGCGLRTVGRRPVPVDQQIDGIKVALLLKAIYKVNIIIIKTPKTFFKEKQHQNSHQSTEDAEQPEQS